MRLWLLAALLFFAASTAHATDIPVEEELNIESVTVLASTSMSVALTEISKAYSRADNVDVNTVYDSSGELLRSIEDGEPADIIVTPSKEFFDKMKEEGLLDASTAKIIASNKLVLVASKDLKLDSSPDIAVVLKQIHNKALMVIGDPNMTMLGYASRIAIENLHLWPEFEKRVILAPTSTKTMDLLIKGQTAGIVYETDAKLYKDKINNFGTIPDKLHPPINYYAAVVVSGNMVKARKYLQFLSSPSAKSILNNNGFLIK